MSPGSAPATAIGPLTWSTRAKSRRREVLDGRGRRQLAAGGVEQVELDDVAARRPSRSARSPDPRRDGTGRARCGSPELVAIDRLLGEIVEARGRVTGGGRDGGSAGRTARRHLVLAASSHDPTEPVPDPFRQRHPGGSRVAGSGLSPDARRSGPRLRPRRRAGAVHPGKTGQTGRGRDRPGHVEGMPDRAPPGTGSTS